MNIENWISLQNLGKHYQLELNFFFQLQDLGLIEIEIIEQDQYIHENHLLELERIIRLHHEFELNPEGLDIIIHLLQKIEKLQKELLYTQNKLRRYES